MRRIALWIPLCLCLVGLACQSASDRPSANVVKSSSFRPEELNAVAFLGLASGSMAGEEAQRLMEPLIESHLLATQLPFVVLPLSETERRARAQQSIATLRGIQDYWRDAKRVDKFEIARLGEQLGVDAVLVGVVEEWTQVDATSGTVETSFTRIAAGLKLYSVETGRCLWRAEKTETMEPEGIDIEMDTGSEQLTARQAEAQARSATVQARGRALPPPRFELVAETIATALAQALAS
jgi:hypothetical protein